MKKRVWLSRIFCLVVSMAFLLGALGGCDSTAGEASDTPDASNTERPLNTSQGGQKEVSDDASGMTLPIVDETVSYSLWHGSNPMANTYMSDFSEHPVFIEMENRTNITLEFIGIAAPAMQENFNIIVNAGDYPDIMDNGAGRYTAGADASIEDGIFIRLNELIDEYVPNYQELINTYPNAEKDITTDGGNIVGFYGIHNEPSAQRGLVIRQDMLDELGLDTPVTIDDYTTALTAMNTEYGATLGLAANGVTSTAFVSAYGVIGEIVESMGMGFELPFYEDLESGAIKYGPAEEGYREYLTLMNQWWDAGLIYPDFLTEMNPMEYSSNVVANGTVALFSNSQSQATLHNYDLAGQSADPDFQLTAVPEPVLREGDTTHFAAIDSYVDPQSWNITTVCENVEILARYVNYWYSEEGSLLASYGIQGVSMEYGADGNPHFTDVVLNNPDGISQNVALYIYAVESGPFAIDVTRLTSNYTAQQKDAAEIWMQNRDAACTLPSFSMTADEGSRYNQLVSEIVALTQEMTLKFIMGQRPLSDFDMFVAELEAVGVNECIEIQEVALARYNAR